MWSFSNSISNRRLRKVSTEPKLCYNGQSDDDMSSSSSREEGLECLICFESFNIVENVPYVLWCGHTLCKNCVLGLQWAVLTLPVQKIRLPFFVSCPWCNLFSLRLVCRGNVRFPRKNYFILWMVESLNGERSNSSFTPDNDSQQLLSPRRNLLHGSSSGTQSSRRTQSNHFRGLMGPNGYGRQLRNNTNVERPQFSLHKSLDYFIHMVAKFTLVVIFLVIVSLVIPGSVTILVFYLILTFLLAIPSCLVLYFAYPMLDWLVREITG